MEEQHPPTVIRSPGSTGDRTDPAPQLRVLLLCDKSRSHASTLREHIAAFPRYSRHRVDVFDTYLVPDSAYLDLADYDVVVIHYSLVVTGDSYLSPALREKIRAFSGLKVQFLQDEYRWIDSVTEMMRWLGIGVLFTIVPPRELPKVYGGRLPGVELVPTLAGYVPERLARRRSPPLEQRPLEVGYRGRVLPYWIGALAQEKVAIAREFLARADRYGLRVDIAWSEWDRIYGERWNRFLESCRTTLGTESGASISDFDGSVERAVHDYLRERPGASFGEVSRHVLAPYEGNVVMNVVSPRIFEAAALRTAMVLFPGEYEGTVRPWEHYVPLEKDFSNMDEVVEAIRDLPLLRSLAARAHADLVESGQYSLRSFVSEFDDLVASRVTVRGKGGSWGYRLARVERVGRTRTALGLDPSRARATLGRARATARLVRGDRPLRRVLVTYAGEPAARGRIRPRRLTKDLLRLGILRRLQAGTPVTSETFALRVELDENEGTLVFRSVPLAAGGVPADPRLTDRIRAALSAGRVRLILWDHTAVGLQVHFRYPSGRWLGIPVGYYGVIGIHHFGPLAELARHSSGVVWEAIAPLCGPAAAPPEPRRRGAVRSALALARHPRYYLAKSALLVKALATNRRLARLALRGLRTAELRHDVTPARLLQDALKLYAVHAAHAARVATVSRVETELLDDGRTLRFKTCATPPIAYGTPWVTVGPGAEPTRVIWDNSEVGHVLAFPVVGYRGLALEAGPGGTHEFRALTALLGRFPAETLAALLPEPRPPRRVARLVVQSYAAKGWLALRALAGSRTFRALLLLYVRDRTLRRRVRARVLLRDLVNLSTLHRAWAGRVGPVARLTVELCEDGRSLRFRTAGSGREAHVSSFAHIDRSALPSSIVWDNSELGKSLQLPLRFHRGHRIAVGPDCSYSFDALAALMQRLQAQTWAVLLPPTE